MLQIRKGVTFPQSTTGIYVKQQQNKRNSYILGACKYTICLYVPFYESGSRRIFYGSVSRRVYPVL